MDKTLRYLGLARRAGCLAAGEDNTGAAVRSGKTRILLLAHDASDNAVRRAAGFAAGGRIPLITLPYTKQEISEAIGKGLCSMAAVTDIGMAGGILESLEEAYPGKYTEAKDEVIRKKERARVRKRKPTESERNKGKGRTNI